MDMDTSQVGWSDEQWGRVIATIQQEAQQARVAAQFLSSTQAADKTAVAVPDRTLGFNLAARAAPAQRLRVQHTPETYLTSISINVALKTQEVRDPELAGALIQFRRAANLIARIEDALIFRGRPGPNAIPSGIAALPRVFEISGEDFQQGLLDTPYPPRLDTTIGAVNGNNLVTSIIDGIGTLEAAGQNRPFACVLGHDLFTALHTPAASLVMPRDRVIPFLDGAPLLRTSTLPPDHGLLVALGGNPPEIVISSELAVRFLQTTLEPRYVIRISERIALRVVDWTSILVLHP